MAAKKGSGAIHIATKNQGKLRRATGAKKGAKIPMATLQRLKNSKNPTTRKRANFAINARSWNHKR